MSGAIKSVFKGIKKVVTGAFNIVRPILPIGLMAAAIAAPYLAPLMMNGMGFTAALGQLGGSAGFWGSMVSGVGGTLLAQAAGASGTQAMAIGGLANGMFNALGFNASANMAGQPASGMNLGKGFRQAMSEENPQWTASLRGGGFDSQQGLNYAQSMAESQQERVNRAERVTAESDDSPQQPAEAPPPAGTQNTPQGGTVMTPQDIKDIFADMNKKTWKDYALPIGAAAVGGFLEGAMAPPSGWSPLAPVFDDKGSQFVYKPRQKGDLAYGVWEEHVESKNRPGAYVPKYKVEGVA